MESLFLSERHYAALMNIAEAEAKGRSILQSDFWKIRSSQARSLKYLKDYGLIDRSIRNGVPTLCLTEKGKAELKEFYRKMDKMPL